MAAKRLECPFIIANYKDKRNENKLTCEAGKLSFPDGESFDDYVDTYCANQCGWSKCSMAVILQRYYERI